METKNDATMPPADEPKPEPSMHDRKSETGSKIDDLMTLSRVSAAISGLTDLEGILRVGLNSVLGIINGVVGGIMLMDESL